VVPFAHGDDEPMADLTRADLQVILPREGFPPDSYRLFGGFGAGECYVLDHGPAGWEVYYSERGTKSSLRVFSTQGQACRYFLDLLRDDPTTRSR
jgi:hypothetical protein